MGSPFEYSVCWILAILVLAQILFECVSLEFPSSISLSAGVLHAPPFAVISEKDVFGRYFGEEYSGFQPDMLERLVTFANKDNVNLTFSLHQAPKLYDNAFDLIANDCNTTANPNLNEDCLKYDFILGDFYSNGDRSLRAELSPPWLRTTISSVKYLDKKGRDYDTLTQVQVAKETVCVLSGTYLMDVVKQKFPLINYKECSSPENCIETLKSEKCVLYVEDELQLRYRATIDASLEVTREQLNSQFIIWPVRDNIDPVTYKLLKKWMYDAIANATLDDLYFNYFATRLCPIGWAGENCDKPCDARRGSSDRNGKCICESTKWTGEDCSVEVAEDHNMIPPTLKILGYCMFGINATLCFVAAFWIWINRKTTQVKIAQPYFLYLILFGCLISSSTILAMAREDDQDGPVYGCAAIPWLYSVGFSITFGTLFAKIQRIHKLFQAAASMRRIVVSVKSTMRVIGVILAVDVTILILWTVLDPLQWQHDVIIEDKFGDPLESQGYCTCEYVALFAGLIAVLHFGLLGFACYLCYISRKIPTRFSEGKYLGIAMVSNFQILLVGLPVLVLIGRDAQTSFFVRSAIIWMNDFVILLLIFGNLIHHVHFGDNDVSVQSAVRRFSTTTPAHRGEQSSLEQFSTHLDGTGHRYSSTNSGGELDMYPNEKRVSFSAGTASVPPAQKLVNEIDTQENSESSSIKSEKDVNSEEVEDLDVDSEEVEGLDVDSEEVEDLDVKFSVGMS